MTTGPTPDAPSTHAGSTIYADRQELARVLRDAHETDLGIPESARPLTDWQDWLPEADAALSWLAARQHAPVVSAEQVEAACYPHQDPNGPDLREPVVAALDALGIEVSRG